MGRGDAAPKRGLARAQGVIDPEGSSDITGKDEAMKHRAGCSTTARNQEEGPVIWEALPLLREQQPVPRDPETNPDGSASVRARELEEEEALAVRVGPSKGNQSEGTKERRESEGRKTSEDIGERMAPGPGRAKEARADMNLWGET
jgi:hypothetical protein